MQMLQTFCGCYRVQPGSQSFPAGLLLVEEHWVADVKNGGSQVQQNRAQMQQYVAVQHGFNRIHPVFRPWIEREAQNQKLDQLELQVRQNRFISSKAVGWLHELSSTVPTLVEYA